MKFIAILGAGLALSLSGCGSSEDEGPPPFPNSVAPVTTASSTVAESSEDESSDSDSPDETAAAGQYEGTSVEGAPVSPAIDPSVPSEVQSDDSEAAADGQSAEQASDASDGQ